MRTGKLGQRADGAEQSVNKYQGRMVEYFGGKRNKDGEPAGEHDAERERNNDEITEQCAGRERSEKHHSRAQEIMISLQGTF